jgi:hypothetical protein
MNDLARTVKRVLDAVRDRVETAVRGLAGPAYQPQPVPVRVRIRD